MNGHDSYFLPFFDFESSFLAADFGAAAFRFGFAFSELAAASLAEDFAATLFAVAAFFFGATASARASAGASIEAALGAFSAAGDSTLGLASAGTILYSGMAVQAGTLAGSTTSTR